MSRWFNKPKNIFKYLWFYHNDRSFVAKCYDPSYYAIAFAQVVMTEIGVASMIKDRYGFKYAEAYNQEDLDKAVRDFYFDTFSANKMKDLLNANSKDTSIHPN